MIIITIKTLVVEEEMYTLEQDLGEEEVVVVEVLEGIQIHIVVDVGVMKLILMLSISKMSIQKTNTPMLQQDITITTLQVIMITTQVTIEVEVTIEEITTIILTIEGIIIEEAHIEEILLEEVILLIEELVIIEETILIEEEITIITAIVEEEEVTTITTRNLIQHQF
jgi:hypothetical protein